MMKKVSLDFKNPCFFFLDLEKRFFLQKPWTDFRNFRELISWENSKGEGLFIGFIFMGKINKLVKF